MPVFRNKMCFICDIVRGHLRQKSLGLEPIRKSYYCHSERSEESDKLLSQSNCQILRCALNDTFRAKLFFE
jgi:hypothetical protein